MELPVDLDRLLGPRDVVVVEGADAQKYLHSQVSQALEAQAVGEQRWTFVLEPTGKIDALARVTRTADERFELDTDAGFGEAMLTRLNRFKIRVAADTSLHPASDSTIDPTVEHDRIVAGWPRMGKEIVPGETIPGGTGLTGVAVSYTKGCYPGQELVERMDSRAASAPKLLRRLTVEPGTAPGDPVSDGDAEVGVITSVSGEAAIAWIKRTSDVGTPVEFSGEG
jgi:folate-binding protein YgfZ